MIIAIDGPSGAGKSTVSKEVAKRLGYSCLDTGAMYRCIAWKALQLGVSLDDKEALGDLANACDISFAHEAGDPAPKQVFVDGVEVTSAIRTAEIDKSVSAVSSVPAVREAMVGQQQRIGGKGDYVVDGRDIGTVVFPHAQLKIFMTASAEERANRRVKQNMLRGVGSTDYQQVLADIISRDEQDASRDTSPLRAADDAVLLDTTAMDIEQSIDAVCQMAVQRNMVQEAL